MTLSIIANQYRPQSISIPQQVKYPDVDRNVAVLHIETQQQKANAEQYLKASLKMNDEHGNANDVVDYPLWHQAVKGGGVYKVVKNSEVIRIAVLTDKEPAQITTAENLSFNKIDINV